MTKMLVERTRSLTVNYLWKSYNAGKIRPLEIIFRLNSFTETSSPISTSGRHLQTIETVVYLLSRRNTCHVISKSFPQLAPFPRDHDSSLGDFSDDDIIDSDNVVYDVV